MSCNHILNDMADISETYYEADANSSMKNFDSVEIVEETKSFLVTVTDDNRLKVDGRIYEDKDIIILNNDVNDCYVIRATHNNKYERYFVVKGLKTDLRTYLNGYGFVSSDNKTFKANSHGR